MKYVMRTMFLVSLLSVSVFYSCDEDEDDDDAMEMSTAPENVDATVEVADDNSGSVTVTPTGDNVSEFDVYFGESTDETPSSVAPGSSASHTYSEAGSYTIRVVGKSESGETAETTKSVTIEFEATVLGLPIGFESSAIEYTFGDFEGATTTVIANPDASGANTSANVAQFNKGEGAQTFAGTIIELPEAISFGNNNGLSIHTWSPKDAGTVVRLKLEGASPETFAEVDASTTTASSWEELSFDFTGADLTQSYTKIILFFDFGNAGDNANFFFDNIALATIVNDDVTYAFPIDFESSGTYKFADFEGATTSVIANPDASGDNTSANVAQFNKMAGAQTFAGTIMDFGSVLDFGNNNGFNMKVWSSKPAGSVVKLKVENADGSIGAEVDAMTTAESAWETLEFDFGGKDLSQEYTKVIVFMDFGNEGDDTNYYFDEITLAEFETTGGSTVDEVNIDFEGDNPTWTDFGGNASQVIENPDASGINTSGNVLEVVHGNETWGGSYTDLAGALDMSTKTKIKVKVWAPDQGFNIRLKMENLSNDQDFHEYDQSIAGGGEWVEVTFDLTNDINGASAVNGSYGRIVLFPGWDVANAGTFYMDDIQFTE